MMYACVSSAYHEVNNAQNSSILSKVLVCCHVYSRWDVYAQVNPAGRGAGIITLTGWVALAALVSLVMVVVGAVVFAYRKWAGLDKPYTIVTKQGDV